MFFRGEILLIVRNRRLDTGFRVYQRFSGWPIWSNPGGHHLRCRLVDLRKRRTLLVQSFDSAPANQPAPYDFALQPVPRVRGRLVSVTKAHDWFAKLNSGQCNTVQPIAQKEQVRFLYDARIATRIPGTGHCGADHSGRPSVGIERDSSDQNSAVDQWHGRSSVHCSE